MVCDRRDRSAGLGDRLRHQTFEDTVTNLVGALYAARAYYPDADLMARWTESLERVLRTARGEPSFRAVHDEFVDGAHGKVPGPTWQQITASAEYLLHRMHTRTPPVYDRMLRHITILYCAMTILMVPGLTGMIASLLVVYVLGGMLVVIDSMDRTIEGDHAALVDADLTPLSEFHEALMRRQAVPQAAG